jgi:hypothetical protein
MEGNFPLLLEEESDEMMGCLLLPAEVEATKIHTASQQQARLAGR